MTEQNKGVKNINEKKKKKQKRIAQVIKMK